MSPVSIKRTFFERIQHEISVVVCLFWSNHNNSPRFQFQKWHQKLVQILRTQVVYLIWFLLKSIIRAILILKASLPKPSLVSSHSIKPALAQLTKISMPDWWSSLSFLAAARIDSKFEKSRSRGEISSLSLSAYKNHYKNRKISYISDQANPAVNGTEPWHDRQLTDLRSQVHLYLWA